MRPLDPTVLCNRSAQLGSHDPKPGCDRCYVGGGNVIESIGSLGSRALGFRIQGLGEGLRPGVYRLYRGSIGTMED